MSKYIDSLIKGNETLTNKVKILENELNHYRNKYNEEMIKNNCLEYKVENYKLQITKLNNRIKELEERDPIESMLNLRKRLGL